MNDIIKEINKLITQSGSKTNAARVIGISPQYLGDIMTGRKKMTDKLAARLGWSRVTYWVKQQ